MTAKANGAPVRAAIYTRISVDRDDTRLGVERQEEDCRRLCAERGWEVAGVYCDNNVSAAKVGTRRPEYERLLRDIEERAVDAVAVWAEDRLHRRPVELEAFVATCEAAGMHNLASVSGDVDLNDPDALMLLRFKGAMAKRERDKIVGRLLRQRQQLADKGLPYPGGPRRFGWERDGATIRREEAALVTEAAARVLAGEPVRAVARDWNGRGVPTVKGGPWSMVALRTILRSPRNAGLRVHRGEVVGEGTWEPIVPRETWDKLQAVLDAKRPAGPRAATRKYPLRGIIRCGACGMDLVAAPRTGKDGRRVHYYGCRKDPNGKYAHGGCGRVYVRADHAERHVVSLVLRYVDDPRVLALAAGEAEEVTRLLVENAGDQARVDEWERAYTDGDLSLAGLRRAKAGAQARIEQRSARVAQLSGTAALGGLGGRVSEHWDELGDDRQRAIIGGLVHKVDVLPLDRPSPRFQPSRLRVRWRLGALGQATLRQWDAMTPLEQKRAEREYVKEIGPKVDEYGSEYEATIGSGQLGRPARRP